MNPHERLLTENQIDNIARASSEAVIKEAQNGPIPVNMGLELVPRALWGEYLYRKFKWEIEEREQHKYEDFFDAADLDI